MLLVFRWIGIIPVAVFIADRPIFTVYNHFATLIFRDLACRIDRILLGIGFLCEPLIPSPLTPHLLSFVGTTC